MRRIHIDGLGIIDIEQIVLLGAPRFQETSAEVAIRLPRGEELVWQLGAKEDEVEYSEPHRSYMRTMPGGEKEFWYKTQGRSVFELRVREEWEKVAKVLLKSGSGASR